MITKKTGDACLFCVIKHSANSIGDNINSLKNQTILLQYLTQMQYRAREFL
jgi:hypothetical protein